MKIIKLAYSKIWVPIFGRILYRFVEIIEGKKPEEKPTFDIEAATKEYKSN